MADHGDLSLGSTLDLKFTTAVGGVPTTLAGSPVISAYPTNSTTELTAGITLTVDFDARTGLHHVRVVATSGNGYAAASDYQLVITTGTVGGNSVVGTVIGSFSIEARSALRPLTAGRTLDVTAANKVQGVVLADTLTTYTGNTLQTGDSYTRLGAAGAGLTALGDARVANLDATVSSRATQASVNTVSGYVDTEVAAIKAKTDQLTFSNPNQVDAGVFFMGAATIDSSVLTTDAVTAIRAAGYGTADSGSTTTVVDAERVEADTDYWKGSLIVFTTGFIAGQFGIVTGFNPATDTLTFSPPTTQPVTTQKYELRPVGDFLRPTTTGRQLDVSAGGEAGVDWANVGTPGSTVGLSATTVGTATNLTNAPTAGDLTAAMKASVTTAATASTPALSAAGVDAILDDPIGDGTITARQALRVILSALAGKLSGAATATVTIRNVADSANVIVASVDANGNRSATTVTP